MADTILLSVEEMYQADALAVAAGVASLDLMEAAGAAIAAEIQDRWQPRPVCVLAGPGNNGGDGFVVARLLTEAGWPVRLAFLGSPDSLKADAAVNAGRWHGAIEELTPAMLDGRPLVVDALFGAGLTRPLDGAALSCVHRINQDGLDCLAVDIPSGVDGDSGEILGGDGGAPRAAVTVTFFRAKPGHYLMPGRALCGDLIVTDIGIPASVLDQIAAATRLNGPGLWLDRFPWPDTEDHKYSRGHAVVAGGAEMTGAARLAAMGARRMGAGLVTIATPPEAFAAYAREEPGTLVKKVENDDAFRVLLGDPKKNAILVGPGLGVSEGTRAKVLAALETGKPAVIDADGLSAFAENPQQLFKAITGPCLLTPHEGEFNRLFSLSGGKVPRVRAAARLSGAVVLLKGADTVIAAPGEQETAIVVINATGTADLATAGTGDVLAGMALGLMTQGLNPFDAAACAVWLHGRAAEQIGPGLIAEDLPSALPGVLRTLKENASKT
ncbi:MAG: NAD(P)H-hydrate dehydratase [Proteobacteria bacterium]|nr:NAD(P)H-hydrate dehydratase [Pseudomonadota bacterium]